MKKGSITSHPLFGVFIGIGIVVVYNAFEAAISPAMYGVLGPSWQWIKLVLFYVLLGWAMKWMLYRAMPQSFTIEPMSAADFAGISEAAVLRAASQVRAPLPDVGEKTKAERGNFALDFGQLDARSRELESLGFVLQIEGAPKTDKASVPTFARIWKHPEGSWAEVFQAFPRGVAPTPLTFALLTYFEDGWLCGDSTMKTNWVLWMIRRPRSVGKLHSPETPASQIWASHRERCTKLHQKLGVRILPLDLESYFGRGVENLREGRRLLLRRSILVSMIQSSFARRGSESWKEVDKYAATRSVKA